MKTAIMIYTLSAAVSEPTQGEVVRNYVAQQCVHIDALTPEDATFYRVPLVIDRRARKEDMAQLRQFTALWNDSSTDERLRSCAILKGLAVQKEPKEII
ncbi:MAG: hypothetical protein V7739_16760 [Motiliproteus sp.]